MACELTAWMAMLALDGTKPDPPQPPRKGDPRDRGTPHTRRDSRATAHGRTLQIATSHSLRRPHQDHETSRLVATIDLRWTSDVPGMDLPPTCLS
jgi:hypothetical protein